MLEIVQITIILHLKLGTKLQQQLLVYFKEIIILLLMLTCYSQLIKNHRFAEQHSQVTNQMKRS